MYDLKKIQVKNISVIVPVKDNSIGLNNLIHSFYINNITPLEIIVVDNNSKDLIEIKHNLSCPIIVHKCHKIGPAAARNLGVSVSKGNWLYFTDSDCIISKNTFNFEELPTKHSVFCGIVKPLSKNYLTNFYTNINLLNSPKNKRGKVNEILVVTANFLIKKETFNEIGGFDESFTFAGGEDIDLGIRLSKKYSLFINEKSIVFHNYKYSLNDFYTRFFRYGKALKLINNKHATTNDISSIVPLNIKFWYFPLKMLMLNALNRGYNSVD